jgi:hypothetical protein
MQETDEFPNHYRQQLPYLVVALLVSVALFVIGVTNEATWAVISMIVGIISSTVAVILVASWWIMGNAVESQLMAFRAGEHLARWKIEPDDWNAFVRVMKRKLRLVAGLIGGSMILVAVLIGGMLLSDGDSNGAAFMGWGVAGSLALWVALDWAFCAGWKKRLRPVLVVYGPAMGVFDGQFISWATSGYMFIGAAIDEGARRIVIETEVTANKGQRVRNTLRLPFPPEAVGEARALVAALLKG